jgi:hypothetical protein
VNAHCEKSFADDSLGVAIDITGRANRLGWYLD